MLLVPKIRCHAGAGTLHVAKAPGKDGFGKGFCVGCPSFALKVGMCVTVCPSPSCLLFNLPVARGLSQ